MGFCSDQEYEEFFRSVPEFERMLMPYKDLTPKPVTMPKREKFVEYQRPEFTAQRYVPEHIA